MLMLSVSGKMIISVKYLLGIVSCVVVYGIKSIVLLIASYLSTISTTGRSYKPKMLQNYLVQFGISDFVANFMDIALLLIVL